MTTLRAKLIHLAHTTPALRPHVLPLLKTSGFESSVEDDGWEILSGPGLEKAQKVTGAKVTIAKKIGRKTVFAREHGMVTLYVILDNGKVHQEEFGKLPNDNKVKQFLDAAMASETGAKKASEDEDLCVVCGKPGEVIRYTVRGEDKTPLAGRIFLKGTALCEKHQTMCESYTASKD